MCMCVCVYIYMYIYIYLNKSDIAIDRYSSISILGQIY